jgi:transcriptional regulator with XRE-family HTH domain
MTTPLLTRARQDAGLSKAELARRAHTSRTTVSAYEHGAKTPTLTTLERLVGVAGFELVLQPRPTFAVAGEHRGAPVLVPDRLPALAPAEALARIELPLHLEWSNEVRRRDLVVRAERIRVYELVLREGTPDDVLRYVDPTLLLDVFDELNLPEAIRAAWQPAVARWRGR